jgi:IS4 transposase
MIWAVLVVEPRHDTVHEVSSVAFFLNRFERFEDPERFDLRPEDTGCNKSLVIKETRNPGSF